MAQILRDMKYPPVEEDTDKSEPGTQGDKEEYQKKRKEIANKFGVESCSALKDEEKRKACYAALDAAHVSDDEEESGEKKEEVGEAKVKHECPKCKGKGCDHCDGKGYHLEDEDGDPVGKNEEVEIDEGLYSIKNTKTGQRYSISKYKDDKKLDKIRKGGGDHKHAAHYKDGKLIEEVELNEFYTVFAVRHKEKDGKRYVIPFKTKQKADKKAKELKSAGATEIARGRACRPGGPRQEWGRIRGGAGTGRGRGEG